ncbi:phospholipase A1-like [Pectinophora gossypiella]|uniref:phospholipase A1-like n=1 Tax=Pectinophora gossypiella TaxID=13191 RepID=UPI00214ED3A8|nr:phospholipase A1-like [Pectinophora gossypiella]
MSVFFLFIFGVFCAARARQDTGYPAGLMADCPGMNRSTTFSKETLKSLSVVVMKPSQSLLGTLMGSGEKRCQLSEEGAECVANFIDLKKKKIQVLISGYMDASFSPLVRTMTGVYLSQGRTIIVVEIFPLLVRTYPVAARVTRPLGELLGVFLASLTRRGLPPSQLQLVGGSLGAHVASFAAVKYRQLTGRRPARLTGLDPAGPCFRNLPATERFHRDAAERTDALHTNIDGFGIADAVAHVDFYANGGEFQPAMVGDFILPCFLLCSHVRAAYYWILAYKNPDKFLAVRCDSVADARLGRCYHGGTNSQTNLLGPKTNFTTPGVYYLPTKETPPYYLDDATSAREYGANNYLLKTARDEDMVL